MPFQLSHNAYGKSGVRLTKVARRGEWHELAEITVDIQLEGDFDVSYTEGDNGPLVATDTMKNTVYALAKDHPLTDIEGFGLTLAAHFLNAAPHVHKATVHLMQQDWQRIRVDGQPHPHAFQGGAIETRTASITQTHEGVSVVSGLTDLLVLKTANSAFTGFQRDRFTTLPETEDRILATSVTAEWTYRDAAADWNARHAAIREAMLTAFAGHNSRAVQQTLHAMGEAALNTCAEATSITLTLPNKHRILVDLSPFGMENANEVFVAVDAPFGLISGTLTRE